MINPYKAKFNEMVKAKTPSHADLKLRTGKQSQVVKAQMLRRLLTANTDEEKLVINNITSCIKYMHQNYDIEWFRLNRIYQ